MGFFKSKVNIIVLIFFIASIIFATFSVIFNNLNKDDSINTNFNNINNENVDIYIDKEYIVTNYTSFYTVESIIQQFISALTEERYEEVYSILSSDLAGDISKEIYLGVLSEYYIKNYKEYQDENGDIITYNNSKNLRNLYLVEENSYIAVINNNHNELTKIGIRLLSNTKYEVSYIEL